MKILKPAFDKRILEYLYSKYNKKEFVHPDPLEFLYNFSNNNDREVVGFISSTLAYGRVDQIIRAISRVLDIMQNRPYEYLLSEQSGTIERDFSDFVYRFTDGKLFSRLLITLKEILISYSSIENCFCHFYDVKQDSIFMALCEFSKIFEGCRNKGWSIIPDPKKNSPLKRMNLFLRWMVRKDDVDPGGWSGIQPSRLIIPLDVHMLRFALENGLTVSKTGTLRVAEEITHAFKQIVPEDPLKYDFVITRPGIWKNSKGCPEGFI